MESVAKTRFYWLREFLIFTELKLKVLEISTQEQLIPEVKTMQS